MADIDLGTEHLRWMGSSRFTYGFLRGGKYRTVLVFVCDFSERRDLSSSSAQSEPVLDFCEDCHVGKGENDRSLTRV
jgi:hypothetical protein